MSERRETRSIVEAPVRPRGRGRPMLNDAQRTVAVSLRIPAPVYDRLCRIATTKQLAVAEVMRRIIAARLGPDRDAAARSPTAPHDPPLPTG